MGEQPEKTKFQKLGQELRREEFDLDEDFVFCNSGSWSCVPRRFVDRKNQLTCEREKNSQLWAKVKEPQLIWASLNALAKFIGARAENITFVENNTEGTNIALKNQEYKNGDKILLCKLHSYNAVVNQAKVVVEENEGVEVVMFEIPFPIQGKEDLVTAYRKALEQHPGVKITVISHISSDPAVLFPIKEIVELCRQHDVITVIDGAHAPGHVNLTVEDYGADYYVGNLCKWMMVPQSVSFLWVDPKHQPRTRPLATSHHCFNTYFRERFYVPITKDRISHVLVKDALEFLDELGGLESMSTRNSQLVSRAAEMLAQEWNSEHLQVSPDCRAPQMALVAYPDELIEAYANNTHLDLEYDLLLNKVTGKVVKFDGKLWCRISCNVWNDWEDYKLLSERVKSMVKAKKSNGRRPTYFIPEPGWTDLSQLSDSLVKLK